MAESLKKVLVTGASGFIGRHVVAVLIERSGTEVKALVRSGSPAIGPPRSNNTHLVVGDLLDHASLRGVCADVDTVFHLAGHAHAEDVDPQRDAETHRRVTVEGTRALLNEAVNAGVRCFVFVSSVKVLGEGGDACLDERSPPLPRSNYGLAKLEAEKMVLAAGAEHNFHAAVLRLPLVYGRDNKGNIPRMMDAIERGRFPPIPEIYNKRSMVHVADVVRALLVVAEMPRARGECYIVTDGRVYSSRELYVALCRALGKKVPAWSIPAAIWRVAAGIGDVAARLTRRRMPLDTLTLTKLFGSAHYTAAKLERELGFRARHSLEEALPEMVAEYRKNYSQGG